MRCGNWPAVGSRCEKEATKWMFDDDGQQNPGGFVCADHAAAIILEYREKIGQEWTAKPIDELGVILEKEAPCSLNPNP